MGPRVIERGNFPVKFHIIGTPVASRNQASYPAVPMMMMMQGCDSAKVSSNVPSYTLNLDAPCVDLMRAPLAFSRDFLRLLEFYCSAQGEAQVCSWYRTPLRPRGRKVTVAPIPHCSSRARRSRHHAQRFRARTHSHTRPPYPAPHCTKSKRRRVCTLAQYLYDTDGVWTRQSQVETARSVVHVSRFSLVPCSGRHRLASSERLWA